MAKGAVEVETGVTWHTGEEGNCNFDIRHELEYGYSDRLLLGLYFADWSYTKPSGQPGKASFDDVAAEAIYNLSDANTSLIGSALYGEVKVGDRLLGLESKVLLETHIGSWIWVYNLGGEIIWRDADQPDQAELMQSAGVSYQLSPTWSIGAELLQEIAVPDVASIGRSGFYVGPNACWRSHWLSFTVTGLWQLSSVAYEPDFQLRTILSLDF